MIMHKILTRADQRSHASDFESMYRARAAVFHDRLGWDVVVRDGLEYDRYDLEHDPVYIVTQDEAGHLTGSLRLLPTTGPTMLKNEFASFFNEPVDFESPTAWECTRFCVHPSAHRTTRDDLRPVSSQLLIGLCELALSSGIENIVGLYDTRMLRIYARIGWSPNTLATCKPELENLLVGIWDVSESVLNEMRLRVSTNSTKLAGTIAA